LPPGVEDTPDVRAKLVSAVQAQLGHADCDHALEKSEKPPKRMRHRAPQTLVDESAKLYEKTMRDLVDEIGSILSE
jgi:hypothetical protein